MAKIYRTRVGDLIRGLTEPDGQEETKEALRALVEKIVLSPDTKGEGLVLDLHGALASLLRLATGQPVHGGSNSKASAGADSPTIDELVLVAETEFQKYLPLSQADWVDQESIAA